MERASIIRAGAILRTNTVFYTCISQIPRLTRPYRRRKLQPTEEAQKWVLCDRCNKWRKLPSDVNVNLLPDKW